MSTANLDSADLKAVAAGGLINEDVMQQIWDISKIPLPFTDLMGENVPVGNSYSEWTTDELAAPDTNNATVDGADASGNDTATGARVGNHCQIPDKVVRVSTRARNSNTIGQSDSLGYQVMMRQQELRRDVEAISLTNQASVEDDGNATAGRMGGFGAWIETHTDRGATGTDGGFNTGTKIVDAPGNGTMRAITETEILDLVEANYQDGGNATKVMTTPKMKRRLSTYLFTTDAKIATLSSEVGQMQEHAKAIGSVDVWRTDFAILELIPNRLQQVVHSTNAVNIFGIDPAHVKCGVLTGYRVEELAKTGTADNRQMLVDLTLVVTNEKAHWCAADCNQTAAVTA